MSDAQLRAGGSSAGTVRTGAASDAEAPTAEGSATSSASSNAAGGAPGAPLGGASSSATAGAASAGGSSDNGGATDVGVTSGQVLLGNVSTLSGPVPGLFAGAVTGAQAVIAYQNSLGGIFGRKLKLEVRDDQFDSVQNRAQTTEQVGKAFAVLGSFSLFDDAAVGQVGSAGIPDFSVAINQSRQKLPNNLSVAPIDMAGGPSGVFEWFKQRYPDAVQHVATLYGDVPASKAQHERMQRVGEATGSKFVYARGYQATETDFTADVIRMRQSGVKAVYLFAVDDKTIARIAKAMKQQNFTPDFAVSNYEPAVPVLAGDAAEGWYGQATQALFASPEEAALNPEIKLFQDWVQKVKPGARPDLYSVYAWALGRLLFQSMEMAGPKLTRAGVIAAARKIGQFSAGDTVAPANPGAKVPATCFIMAQVKGGRYERIDPARGFNCQGSYVRP